MKYKKGVVIGKFMPPHKGHEYLINFAKQYCEQLFVIVDCLKEQTISPEQRKSWLLAQIPNIEVIALKKYMPQDPSEHPDFWAIWRDTIIESVGQTDVLIAAMDYGWKLSEFLNCEFVQCDISRQSIPISATEIRNNPLKHWKYLMDSCKGHFLKKICIIGPESTGKSTIVSNLANEFNTVFVPEYAKAIIDSQNGQFCFNNVEQTALAQVRSEKALEFMTNKIMFCDSDVITTMCWSNILFNKMPNILHQIACTQKYDITYLLYPDTPWIYDSHRNITSNLHTNEFRINMFNMMEQLLIKYNRKYVVVKGDFNHKQLFIKRNLSILD